MVPPPLTRKKTQRSAVSRNSLADIESQLKSSEDAAGDFGYQDPDSPRPFFSAAHMKRNQISSRNLLDLKDSKTTPAGIS